METVEDDVEEFIEGADPEENGAGSVIQVKNVISLSIHGLVWFWSTEQRTK